MRIVPRKGVSEITKPTDIEVTPNDVQFYTSGKGTQNALNKKHGEGNWGDEEVKAYIQERKFAEFQQQPERVRARTVDERFQGYLEAFDAVTPNDREMLRAMAHIEITLESIRQQLEGQTEPRKLKTLAESQTKLLTEHRLLQKTLGIDKAGREKSKKAKSALEEIQELVAEGAAFIEEQLIKVSHCGILIAWLHSHFPEMGYEFKTRCPKCGEEVQISIEEGEHD